MPTGAVNVTDDGECVILTNTRMEVVADRTDPDDPDYDEFTVRTAQAETENDLSDSTKRWAYNPV